MSRRGEVRDKAADTGERTPPTTWKAGSLLVLLAFVAAGVFVIFRTMQTGHWVGTAFGMIFSVVAASLFLRRLATFAGLRRYGDREASKNRWQLADRDG